MAAAAALPTSFNEPIDRFVNGPMSAEAVGAASMASKETPSERALGAEGSHHPGCRPGATRPGDANKPRHRAIGKTEPTDDGPPRIEVRKTRRRVAAGVTSNSSPDRTCAGLEGRCSIPMSYGRLSGAERPACAVLVREPVMIA